jgi:hypothetical protein
VVLIRPVLFSFFRWLYCNAITSSTSTTDVFQEKQTVAEMYKNDVGDN